MFWNVASPTSPDLVSVSSRVPPRPSGNGKVDILDPCSRAAAGPPGAGAATAVPIAIVKFFILALPCRSCTRLSRTLRSDRRNGILPSGTRDRISLARPAGFPVRPAQTTQKAPLGGEAVERAPPLRSYRRQRRAAETSGSETAQRLTQEHDPASGCVADAFPVSAAAGEGMVSPRSRARGSGRVPSRRSVFGAGDPDVAAIAVPVLRNDDLLEGVGLSGPITRFDPARTANRVEALRDACLRIVTT